MSGSSKTARKSLKTNQRANDKRMNIIVLVVFGGALILFAYVSMQVGSKESKANDSYLASLPAQQDTIAHDKICMADDIYQGDYHTLSVRLSVNTYYGCDAKAIHELSIKRNVRFAIDPVTKHKVDKGSAVIGIHSKRDGKVLYFESTKTFNLYLNQQRTQ